MTTDTSYLFDIGKPRPDGKRNIWKRMNVRGFQEWIIVHVAENFPRALGWIKQQGKTP